MHIDRTRERNDLGELASLAIFSLSLPHTLAYELDALCVFSGQGEDIRVLQPMRQYWENKKTKNRFFLVAGHNQKEKTWKELTLENLKKKPFNIKRLEGVHVEPRFVHTKDQAEWTVKKIEELGIKSCGIVATPFHLLRAYMTTLASMRTRNIQIPLIPIPVYLSPENIVPESQLEAWDMIQGEAERILAYQKKGDVISYSEFRKYMNWLWQEPLVKKFL